MPLSSAFTAFGGPENEAFLELAVPEPGPGQILIRVRAAGVNPVDWKRRTGHLPLGAAAPMLPAVFGSEAAGVVERVGPGVTAFAAGDEVFGSTVAGGYAEYALLDADIAAVRPAAVSARDAATLPVARATAGWVTVDIRILQGRAWASGTGLGHGSGPHGGAVRKVGGVAGRPVGHPQQAGEPAHAPIEALQLLYVKYRF